MWLRILRHCVQEVCRPSCTMCDFFPVFAFSDDGAACFVVQTVLDLDGVRYAEVREGTEQLHALDALLKKAPSRGARAVEKEWVVLG